MKTRSGKGNEEPEDSKDKQKDAESNTEIFEDCNMTDNKTDLNRVLYEQILTFDGSATTTVNEFIESLELYFTYINIPDEIQVVIAKRKLLGEAKHWFSTKTEKTSWKQFKDALKAQYCSEVQQAENLIKLSTLKQENSLSEYIQEFSKLRAIAIEVSDTCATAFLMNGLSENVRTIVSGTPENLKNYATLLATLRSIATTTESTRKTNIRSANARQMKVNNKREKSIEKCSICHKKGHTAQTCYRRPGGEAEQARERNMTLFAFLKSKRNSATSASIATTERIEISEAKALYMRSEQNYDFCIDSGCTDHMISEIDETSTLKKVSIPIKTASGETMYSTGVISSIAKAKGGYEPLNLPNVLVVPNLKDNLFSVSAANDCGYDIEFSADGKVIIRKDDRVIAKGHRHGKSYRIAFQLTNSVALRAATDALLWHRRLGHPGLQKLRKAKEMLRGIPENVDASLVGICAACQEGKKTRTRFPAHGNRAKEVLEIVATDICGPMNETTLGGSKYMLTIIDLFSRYLRIFPIPTKDTKTALNVFHYYRIWAERQTGKSIKILRSDNGGEYTSNLFKQYLLNTGITHETTVAGTPQQNGVAERMNRTILDRIRVTLSDSKLPNTLWGEIAEAHEQIINRLPNRMTNNIPYNVFFNKIEHKTNASYWRTLGCKSFVKTMSTQGKLANRATTGYLVNYERDKKAYRIWEPSTNKILVAIDITFDESQLYKDTNPETQDPLINNGESIEITSETYAYATIAEKLKPSDLLTMPDKDKWLRAMQEEISSIEAHDTWEIVERPTNTKILHCRWVLAKKTNANNEVVKYKARLVVKGYEQRYGEDYEETYSPTVNKAALRLIISIATVQKLETHQVDVKTAFLHGDLDKTIFMELPECFYEEIRDTHVAKLKHSLYGLKQSPRMWFKKLSSGLCELGYKACSKDSCVFYKHAPLTILGVYVDDFIIVSESEEMAEQAKRDLSKNFDIVDLGKCKELLGFQLAHCGEHKILHQSGYTSKILGRYEMQNAKGRKTPYFSGKQENENDSDQRDYRSKIGALMFLAVNTRPDISYQMSVLSREMQDPSAKAYGEIKRLFRYIVETKELGLRFTEQSNDYDFVAFSDANWGLSEPDSKSTCAFVIFHNNNLIHWRSFKQPSVAKSSTDSEIVAACECITELSWIIDLYREITSKSTKTLLYIDNSATIAILSGGVPTNRTRYIEKDIAFIADIAERKKIDIKYIQSSENTADLLTKELSKDLFIKHRNRLGLLQ